MIVPSVLLMFFISCGIIVPNDYDFLSNRKVSDKLIYAEAVSSSGNFQDSFEKDSYLGKLSESKLGDLLYQIISGDTRRFYIKEGKNRIHIWEGRDDKPELHELDKSYAFGLVIGQSKDNIYFYNSSKRGRDFCVYSLKSKNQKIISLKDLVIINVAELANENELIVSGVSQKSGLGFYVINKEGEVIRELKTISLKFDPNGDPSLFGGNFYTHGNTILYSFNNKSNIFVFNLNGEFLREIKTIDDFSFRDKSNKNYSSVFDGLYKELFIVDKTIFVRTNIVSTTNKFIVFDKYELLNGKYIESLKLRFKDLDFNKFSFPIWTLVSDSNAYHLLFGSRYTSGKFVEYKIQF